jgi:predicted flap endonuclease-1-like 5' DNA nuclease
VSVNVTVALSGTAGGQEVDRTLEYALPLAVEGSVYRVGSVAQVEPVTRTERVTVASEPGPLGAIGGPVLLGLALLGLAGLVYARSEDRLALTEAEREWLAYRDDRSDFDDWISTIRLPEDARSLPVAEADTLADLVDFAIDTDNAVLEQPGGGAYHVVHDGYRYTFEAPPDPTRAADEVEPESGGGSDSAGEASPAPHPDPDLAAGGGSEGSGTSSGAGGGSGGETDLRSLRGVGPTYAERLREAGVEQPADLLEVDPDRLASAADMPREGVETLVERARELVGEPDPRPDADD